MSSTVNNLYEKLKPKYNEELLMPIVDFARIEALLWLGEKVSKYPNANKLHLLLTSYNIINKTVSSEYDFLLQQAKCAIPTFRSKKIWLDTLEEYTSDNYSSLRAFDVDISTGRYQRKQSTNLFYPDRDTEIQDFILTFQTLQKEPNSLALKGNFKFIKNFNTNEDTIISLDISPITAIQAYEITENINENENENVGEITFTLQELYASAKQMQEILPDDYNYNVVMSNVFSQICHSGKINCSSFELNQVTNIVGMVGAGKSTFVKVLCNLLARKNKRIVLVLDTVSEVLKLHGYFRKLGLLSSPLIGKSDRIKYINQINNDGDMLLELEYSKYLTSCCILDGLDDSTFEAVAFGKEPCVALKKGGKLYTCPYFDVCPVTLMERQIYSSNLIITTAPALASTRVGAAKELYLNIVLKNVDLVIFDECDRVQKNLDEFFAPSVSFDEFIQQSADDCSKFMSIPSNKRRANKSVMRYNQLQLESTSVLEQILSGLQLDIGNWKIIVESSSFSAYTLLENMQSDTVHPIPNLIYEQLYSLIDLNMYNETQENIQQLIQAFELSCQVGKDAQFDLALSSWLKSCNIKVCDGDVAKCKSCKVATNEVICGKMKNQIVVIIRLIYFDRYIAKLGDAYSTAKQSGYDTNELFSFLSSRFSNQQSLLPSALLGNLFGLKKTSSADVYLFKQFAYGRSLMTDMPWLRIDENGKPCGPNVLLLSGSSWAPGSFEYHVSRRVNYLIEGSEEKSRFLENTKFVELNLATRISGSPIEQRSSLLEKITKESIDYILAELKNRKEKILIVVNSYLQATVVQQALDKELAKYNYSEITCSLVRDGDKKGKRITLRRGEVYKFHDLDARILIAPAAAIERGHNIVDETGHSTISSVFFFVRPMPIPDDIGLWNMKLNGYIATFCSMLQENDILKRNDKIRAKAAEFWSNMSKLQNVSLANLPPELKEDVVSTLFVLILQIFGRMARITNVSKLPPTVYFVDGAFRGKSDIINDFDFLKELGLYLEKIMNMAEYKAIATALYEPFYKAYKKGIH